MESKLWYDLVNSKFGDEYLVLYLARQRWYRKIFKIATILFSASGIFCAFQSIKIPTIISCTCIGLVQLSTSIENFVIHSEDDLDNIGKLRMLYYSRTTKLEELWHAYKSESISVDEVTAQFWQLRTSKFEIEELDNKLNIRKFKKLEGKANDLTNNYLTTYYYE